jgi:hypothetical protein
MKTRAACSLRFEFGDKVLPSTGNGVLKIVIAQFLTELPRGHVEPCPCCAHVAFLETGMNPRVLMAFNFCYSVVSATASHHRVTAMPPPRRKRKAAPSEPRRHPPSRLEFHAIVDGAWYEARVAM